MSLAKSPGRPRRARAPEPSGLAARRAAAAALDRVLTAGTTFEAALADALGRRPPLDDRDRGLAYNIVATSLRRLPQIDAVLASFLDRPIDARSGRVRAILISGAAQILFLEGPPHAVVNAATSLAGEASSGRGLKGLVNAVLRRVAAEGPAIVASQDAEAMVLPEWLQQRWQKLYGAAATRAFASLLLGEPPLDLTVRADPGLWAERTGGRVLPGGTVRLAKAGQVAGLPGYAEGAWWVQDAAAAVPARVFGDVAGLRIADLCAAPGGKTAQLAAAGADVTAIDHDRERTARLETNLARLGLDARIVVADATAWRPETPFDAVLLDAPCSATGIMRRHPDILRRRRPEHLKSLTELQSRLLEAAIGMTRPGGRIVYCTCSLEPEEGERQIDRLVEAVAPVRRAPIRAAAAEGFAAARNDRGELRILPTTLAEHGGNDGFFVAELDRT